MGSGREPQSPELVEPARKAARRIRLASSLLAAAATALTYAL